MSFYRHMFVRILIVNLISKRPTFLYARQFASLYYIFECSKRGMIFQKKFVQVCHTQKYIFGEGMRERSVFPFFFSFIEMLELGP